MTMYIVVMVDMNSSRLIVKIPCKSDGILYFHANPQSLYLPIPVSQASDVVIFVGVVKLTMFKLIPKVDTC